MIGSTLGVCEPDEDGKGCQLPISNLFPQNQLIPLKKAALPFHRYRRRFQGSKSVQTPGLRNGKGCRQCQSGQVGFPDPCMKGDPVTTQLWLRKHFRKPHPPLARLEPKCLENNGLINLEKRAGGQIGKSQYMYMYMYRYIAQQRNISKRGLVTSVCLVDAGFSPGFFSPHCHQINPGTSMDRPLDLGGFPHQ